MYMKSFAQAGRHCRYSAVRFGNVLDSRGSVMPTFRKQIALGGPVTVTHPEMTRFFMTIPEAVQLVIQAAAMGGDGDIFILDMGRPIKILELARNMIRLSGFEPGKDIPIEIKGIRPGEKLKEELVNKGEETVLTDVDKILKVKTGTVPLGELNKKLWQIEESSKKGNDEEVKKLLAGLINNYSPTENG